MASFLKYPPKEKLPSISKKVSCVSSPTSSISEVRKDFWIEVVFLLPKSFCASSSPVKYFLNCCMPAVVKSTDGSSGTSELEGTTACPLLLKKLINFRRSSLEFIDCIIKQILVTRKTTVSHQ